MMWKKTPKIAIITEADWILVLGLILGAGTVALMIKGVFFLTPEEMAANIASAKGQCIEQSIEPTTIEEAPDASYSVKAEPQMLRANSPKSTIERIVPTAFPDPQQPVNGPNQYNYE